MVGAPKVTEMIQAVLQLQASPQNQALRTTLLQQLPAAFEYSRWDDLPKDTYVTIGLEVWETERGGKVFRSTLRENSGPGSRLLLIDAVDKDRNMDNGIEEIQITVENEDGRGQPLTLSSRLQESAQAFAGVNNVIQRYIAQVHDANETFARTDQPPSYTPADWIDW